MLPSGKVIKQIYMGEKLPHPPKLPHEIRALEICPECRSTLVYPVEWDEASSTHWEVLLRCPNCEWSEVGVFDQETVDRFDQELDRGTERVLKDLECLAKITMKDDIERFECQAESFIGALERGLIDADDFAR